ncbi:HK97 family phage prohead protease [Acidobacterium sp. S8]|uniref:HK97 family phage prohead protease n=1 Tax=Acidobacterium sp. S8 TaxID=1641854 RepID=UPI00131CE394|nr:HK97 family phage prohead protease [Acidobacterium sp. S8]
MLKRDFKFKVKALDGGDDPDGSFEGLLAVYNNQDLGGDIIVPGAFARTIANQGSQVPLLWQHKTDEPIGTLTLNDGPNALSVQGQLLLALPTAVAAYQLLKSGIIRGLSIGYDIVQDSVEGSVRYLKELRLWEGSIVTFPMNQAAVIQAIKSNVDDDREVIAELKRLAAKAERAAGAPNQRMVRRGR